MKTYFKALSTVTFGSKEHNSGYPGFFSNVPEIFIIKDEEFSIEYRYNSEKKVRLEKGLEFVSVSIFEVGNLLLQAKIKQIDFLGETEFNKKIREWGN
jgi:hypothetical protein